MLHPSGLIRSNKHPGIGIRAIGSETPRDLLLAHAIQLSAFTKNVIHPYYEQTLNLQRIDTDPRPNPRDNSEVVERMARLMGSGPVETAGKRYFFAVQLDRFGRADLAVRSLVGILITSKPNLALCDEDYGHQPTEIEELDVAPAYRSRHIGRSLLSVALREIHDEDMVTLDVARPNQSARRIYEHYGFNYADKPAMQHGVFDVDHLTMETPAHMLKQKLDI
jgi:ribosomal protein S18 acetylase RimI-like enzyme